MGIKNDLNNARQKALKRGDTEEAERLQLMIDGLTKIRGDRAAGLDTPAFQGPDEYTIQPGDNPFSIAGNIFGDQTAAHLIAEFNPELFVLDKETGTYAFVGQPGDVLDLSFAFAPGAAGPFDPRLLDPGAGNKARAAAAAAAAQEPGVYGAGQQLGLYGNLADPNRESSINAPPGFQDPADFGGGGSLSGSPLAPTLPTAPAPGAGGGAGAGAPPVGDQRGAFYNVPGFADPRLSPNSPFSPGYEPPLPGETLPPGVSTAPPFLSPLEMVANLNQGVDEGGGTITGALENFDQIYNQATGQAGISGERRGEEPTTGEGVAAEDEAAQMLTNPIFDEETGRLIAPPEGTPMNPMTEYIYAGAAAFTAFAANPSPETRAGLPHQGVPNEAAQAWAVHFSAVDGVPYTAYSLMTNMDYFQTDNGTWNRMGGATPAGAGTGSDLDYSRTYRSSGVRNHYRIRKGRVVGPGLGGPGPRPDQPGGGGGGGGGGAQAAVMWNVRFPERT
jgi:hypothetical protein